jgi:hypothetical protein
VTPSFQGRWLDVIVLNGVPGSQDYVKHSVLTSLC